MRAYVGCDNGHVYCLSLSDGSTLWKYPEAEEEGIGCVESSPTVYAGNVYVGTSWFSDNGEPEIYALTADTGALVWAKSHREEARATCAIADAHVFLGVDTGSTFYRLDSATGEKSPDSPLTNPFDASLHRPDPQVSADYFVGSAALDPAAPPGSGTPAGFCLVGNDNHALYTLFSADLTLLTMRDLAGVVCSSPAISYAAESGCRWAYILVRPGTLRGFRQAL
jgi:outer membrane protein assembly factor BamB